MNRVELFPGWEVRRATFDMGTKWGIAVQREIRGRKRRYAIRQRGPRMVCADMAALKGWVSEQERD